MLLRKFFLAMTVFTGTLFASAAHAASITVDFSGSAPLQKSLTFSDLDGAGLDLVVTARQFHKKTGTLFPKTFKIAQHAGGLGVCSGKVDRGTGLCSKDDHKIDGKKRKELVLFSFTKDVKLTEVIFSHVDGNDDFAFRSFTPRGEYFRATDIPRSGHFVFTQDWTGTVFGIGAGEHNDAFKIRALTFDMQTTVIPLPASAWMLLAGVLGLGVWKRRRSA